MGTGAEPCHPVPVFFSGRRERFRGRVFFHGLRRVLKRICARPSRRHMGLEDSCISLLFLGILF